MGILVSISGPACRLRFHDLRGGVDDAPLGGRLILRWAGMNEAEQAFSIITPDQIILNVFATIVFWGLVLVTRQNPTVAGIVGMVLYVIFAARHGLGGWGQGASDQRRAALKFGERVGRCRSRCSPSRLAVITHMLRIFLLSRSWRRSGGGMRTGK